MRPISSLPAQVRIGLATLCWMLLALGWPVVLPAANGFLKITSNLENLEVRIGTQQRQLQGKVLVSELAAGTYEVAALGIGLEHLNRSVTVEADKVTSLELNVEVRTGFRVREAETSKVERRTGALTVVTDAPGAKVWLNGQAVESSQTPLTVEGLTAGIWRIRAELGAQKAEASVTVSPDKTEVARLFFDPVKERSYLAESRQKLEAKRLLQKEFDDATVRIAELRRKIEELSKARDRYASRDGRFSLSGGAGYKAENNFDHKQTATFYDLDGREHTLVAGATGTGSYSKQGRNESEVVNSYFWVEVNGQAVFGVNRRFEWERENSVVPGWSYKDYYPENSDPTIKQQIRAGVYLIDITIYKNSRSMEVSYTVPKEIPSVSEGIGRCEREVYELIQKRERLHFALSTLPN